MNQTPTQLTFDSVSSSERRTIFWGFFWRSIVVTIIASAAGGVVGGVLGFGIGFVASAAGHSVADFLPMIRVVSGFTGLLVALLAYWQFIRWLFRARFGDYVLCLTKSSSADVA